MGRYVVTGGASGIGAAIREQLLAAGHEVIVVDIRKADILADLGTPEGRREAVDLIRARASDGLDGLVTSAGVNGHVPDRAAVASVNFFGTVDLIDGLEGPLARRRGAVVLVSSNSAPGQTSGKYLDLLLAHDEAGARAQAETMPGHLVYSGSKLALVYWMRRKVREHAAVGIRVNAVAPGFTETPMTAAALADPAMGDAVRQFLGAIPAGRGGTPQDQANAVLFLLDPRASFVCGSVLFVDGGTDAMQRPDTI